MDDIELCIVDVQRFKDAVWAVERENFRPGDALHALDRAKVDKPIEDDLARRLAEGAREAADTGDSRALNDALADYDQRG
jgi:hypothetical protein